ncbi:arrestin domain-containing protein 3-like [Lingula anatina]|uniref:Arrestin domain-containing protein 3-like n=1 Tax=Lingula anatina TaxID=7574 RepID=A0A2R2MPL4_LINAN|nr:arrestin domain-containing protein 3-like [Lingula anatina]|eukprot:XP_023932175.1 arrestin domain-containing protein 3-like [Lingula anatina]
MQKYIPDQPRETLSDGRHEFEFCFELPFQCIATSFEGKHGNIRYWLKGELEKPWAFNHKTKKAFTVISPIDINKQEYQLPVENSVEKSLCCWLCISGPISVCARTDRRGYCPGESIAISADFENHSSRTIIPYATLHQTQTFFANGKSRLRSTKFTVLTGLPITPGNRATWDAQLLKIPAVSPSIINCGIIKVEYYVKVALHIPGAYNLSVHLPIVIGTVPYRRFSPYMVSYPRVIEEVGVSYFDSRMLPVPPPYREMSPPLPAIEAPPTYAETYSGAVDIRDEDDDDNRGVNMGDWTYTPMYTYVYGYRYRPPPAYSEIDPNPVTEDQASNVAEQSSNTRL